MTKLIETYYTEQRDNLVRSISRRAGNIPNAEDVVQEAFTRALTYSGSFTGETQNQLAAWFKTIMYRSLKDMMNEERNQGGTMTSEEPEEELTSSADDVWAAKVGLKKLYDLIHSKPTDVSKTLYLHHFGGYKPKEISQIVDEPYDTIKKRIARFKVELEEAREGSGI